MRTSEKAKKKAKLRHAEYYGMQDLQDSLYARSLKGEVFQNLVELITTEENIRMAYRNLKKNSGSRTAGTDGRTIWNLANLDEETLINLVRRKFNYYRPQAIRRVEIPKSNGKTRPLGIPTILDRLIQQCVLQILEPICEAKFFERSNGFRPNRSAENAIAQFCMRVQTMDLHYVIDIDIKGFFDNVNHGKLLKQMWTMGIRDKKLLKILSVMLKAEVAGIGFPEKGTPQGSIISPLLSNIVLNELDWWVASQWELFPTAYQYKTDKEGRSDSGNKYATLRKRSRLKECYIIRYADDFKILCKKRSDAIKLFAAVREWLHDRLGLEISPEKSKIVNLKRQYSEFLGFKMKVERNGTKRDGSPRYTIASFMNDKAAERVKEEMKKQIRDIEFAPQSDEAKYIARLNSYVYGVHSYYSIGTRIAKQFADLAFPFKKSLKNRLNTRITSKAKLDRQGKQYRFPEYLRDRYGKCNSLVVIKGFVIAPLWYIRHRNPMDKPRAVNQYTADGRAYIHDNLKAVNMSIVGYLARNPIKGQSAEYNDNRISVFIAQHGRCAITGAELEIGDMNCHHLVPQEIGGTDAYGNLKYVTYAVHKAIHATRVETLTKYIKSLHLSDKQVRKLNDYRRKAGNDPI